MARDPGAILTAARCPCNGSDGSALGSFLARFSVRTVLVAVVRVGVVLVGVGGDGMRVHMAMPDALGGGWVVRVIVVIVVVDVPVLVGHRHVGVRVRVLLAEV